MAWETRGRGGLYYTRSVKRGGRVYREYLGCGPLAELAAELDADKKTLREQHRAQSRMEREAHDAIDAEVKAFSDDVELWARVALIAAGYHQHNREHGGDDVATNQIAMTDEKNAWVDLVRLAEDGDPQALAQLRQRANTDLPLLWDAYGAMVTRLEGTLLQTISSTNALMRESIKRKAEELRQSLGWDTSSPLERLLIERVALCWMQMYYEDMIAAQQCQKSGIAWAQSLNQQKRAEVAQRRFHMAVKSLSTVRRLAVPVIQMNFANQQINVATPTALPASFKPGGRSAMKATAKLKRDLAAAFAPLDQPREGLGANALQGRNVRVIEAVFVAVEGHLERRDIARKRHARRARPASKG